MDTTDNQLGKGSDVILSLPQRKAIFHGDRLLTEKGVDPILLEVDLTGYCNANCPWCFYKGMESGTQLEGYLLIKALHDTPSIKAVNWTGGGEPTLHSDINEIIQRVEQKQGIFTNGFGQEIYDPGKLSWMRISMTDKYMAALDPDLVKSYAAQTTTGICYNLTASNEAWLEESCVLAKEWGVAYFQVRPALVRDYREQITVKPPVYLRKHETEDFKVWITDYKFKECIKPKYYTRCYGGALCLTLDYNGNVRWCNYFLHTEEKPHVIGNFYEETLSEIFQKAPRFVPVDDTHMNCCKNHEINKLLFEVLDDAIEDKEFI